MGLNSLTEVKRLTFDYKLHIVLLIKSNETKFAYLDKSIKRPIIRGEASQRVDDGSFLAPVKTLGVLTRTGKLE